MQQADNQIQEKYLERAIRELNKMTHELQESENCKRANRMPVLGSGHPQADIFLLKYSATKSEIDEGVAFYGRSGNALIRAFKRLAIDPLAIYGTVCLKCPAGDPPSVDSDCMAKVNEELAIVMPKILIIMGSDTLDFINRLELPLANPIEPMFGQIQKLTPSIDALYTPNIDQALDEENRKRSFWAAFKRIGEWYADLPPY